MREFRSDLYQTKDLGETAALINNDMLLVEIKREGGICWFLFDNKDKCQLLSKQFFFGKLLIDARTYYETLGRLKNRIFSQN